MEKKYKPINRRRMERVSPHIWDVTDLCEAINHHGERIVFRYFEGKEVKSLTYAAFGEMVHAMAAAFNAMGLTGEKVVVIGDASPQWHCTYLAALAAGKLLYNRFIPSEKCIMQYGTLVTNSGFAGLPLIGGAFGDEGLFLASLFIIPTRILMWSAGISLFTTGGTRWERTKKVMTNPSIIAVFLGLGWMVFGLSLPDFLGTAIDHLGDCTSPLAMALVGAILADVPVRGVWEPKALYLVVVRQIALPVLCLLCLKALQLDALTIGVSVTLSGMPIGSTTAILAQKYGADARFASKCVFISTLASLLTVPVLTLFL